MGAAHAMAGRVDMFIVLDSYAFYFYGSSKCIEIANIKLGEQTGRIMVKLNQQCASWMVQISKPYNKFSMSLIVYQTRWLSVWFSALLRLLLSFNKDILTYFTIHFNNLFINLFYLLSSSQPLNPAKDLDLSAFFNKTLQLH